jgi:putative membrane protein
MSNAVNPGLADKKTILNSGKNVRGGSPYMRFKGGDLILRDELAIDRTILANERTLLSYLRSGVALLIAGISIIHYAQDNWFRMVGLLCLPVGVVAAVIGVMRYRKMHKAISLIQRQFGNLAD